MNALLEVVIESNNPNKLLELAAIISVFFIIYTIISVSMSNKRLKKLTHSKKLIVEKLEKAKVENERRKRINEMQKDRNSSN